MSEKPKVRGGLCLNVDGEGCKRFVARDIAREQAKAPIQGGPKSVLVLGCSGGYGLASRIAAAFGGPVVKTACCIGRQTAEEAAKHGFEEIRTAEKATLDSLIKTLEVDER